MAGAGEQREQAGAHGGGAPHSLARIPQGKSPEEWPAELVSELIVTSMKNLPPALPPHLIDVADTPLSMWPKRLANPGAHAKEDGVAKGGGGVGRVYHGPLGRFS